MKITFYSNFLNHHQLPICNEFISKKNIDFTFVATEKLPDERIKLGYEDMNKKYKFVLTTYDSIQNYQKALKLANDSDIVIIGSAPNIFIEERLKDKNKITFRYSERIFKKNTIKNYLSQFKNFRILKNYYKEHKYFLLCSSAYAAKDFNKIGQFKDRCFKWGYFPEVREYDIQKLLKAKRNKIINIVWVARFLDWKHPEYPIYLAEYLNKKGYANYHIKMIGIGEEFNKCSKMIAEKKLDKNITLCGSMPNEKAIEHMKKANIFIFTSDRGEGWGAVLNEAMNNGCAIVANRMIGAAPYLIKHGENGYTYINKKDFFTEVEKLINDSNLREKFGENAYKTMTNVWNARNAVNNLLNLYEKIVNDRDYKNSNYNDGPCSKEIRK